MKLSKKQDRQFDEIVKMIQRARYNAVRSVNVELIKLYWDIGKYINKKIESAEWGDSIVNQLAVYIQAKHPDFKGFTRRGLYRMRQFYKTYRNNKIVSPLVTQLSWQITCLYYLKQSLWERKNFTLSSQLKKNTVKGNLNAR